MEFKFLDYNRPINKRHIDELKESIEKNGYIESLPIVVDTEGYILDGQHRYVACQELGITPPHLTMPMNNKKIIHLINSLQKSWNTLDYIHYYAQLGNPYFIELLRLSKKYNLSPVVTLLMFKSNGGHLLSDIRNENLTFDVSEKGLKRIEEKLQNILRIYECYGVKSNKLFKAICKVYSHKNFITDICINKINLQREKIYKCQTERGYLKVLENIYNYRNSKGIQV